MKNRFVTFSRGCRVALAVAAASVLAQPALAELSGESLVPFMMTKSGKTADEVSKWSDAPLCFDNVKFTSDGSKCWRSQISNSPSITFSLPEEYDELFCVGYRIHRLSTGWYSRDRSPTAWTVEVSTDGEAWLRVDSRSGVVWQGTQTTDGQGGHGSRRTRLLAGVFAGRSSKFPEDPLYADGERATRGHPRGQRCRTDGDRVFCKRCRTYDDAFNRQRSAGRRVEPGLRRILGGRHRRGSHLYGARACFRRGQLLQVRRLSAGGVE